MAPEMIAIRILVLVFSVVVHEVAHGWTALKLGDSTAKDVGRLTLNPLPHIDPVGSIILPLILASTGSPIMFGWAKPVPVRVAMLNDPQKDHAKVAAAGPASNLLLALISAILLGVLILVASLFLQDDSNIVRQTNSPLFFLVHVLETGILLNVALAVFNLLPLPPLDGSWILSRFLPYQYRLRYESLSRFGMLLVIGFLFLVRYTAVGQIFIGLIFFGSAMMHRVTSSIIGLLG